MKAHALQILSKVVALTFDEKEDIKRNNRLVELLRQPEAHDAHWSLCVPKCFNNALDIQLTPRRQKGKTVQVWTQGSSFAFKAGDIIYDTPKAYMLWKDSLKTISLAINIEEARDAIPGKNFTGGISVPRYPGLVRFTVSAPNATKTKLVKNRTMQLSQDAFVLFLISGNLGGDSEAHPNESGTHQDLFSLLGLPASPSVHPL